MKLIPAILILLTSSLLHAQTDFYKQLLSSDAAVRKNAAKTLLSQTNNLKLSDISPLLDYLEKDDSDLKKRKFVVSYIIAAHNSLLKSDPYITKNSSMNFKNRILKIFKHIAIEGSQTEKEYSYILIGLYSIGNPDSEEYCLFDVSSG